MKEPHLLVPCPFRLGVKRRGWFNKKKKRKRRKEKERKKKRKKERGKKKKKRGKKRKKKRKKEGKKREGGKGEERRREKEGERGRRRRESTERKGVRKSAKEKKTDEEEKGIIYILPAPLSPLSSIFERPALSSAHWVGWALSSLIPSPLSLPISISFASSHLDTRHCYFRSRTSTYYALLRVAALRPPVWNSRICALSFSMSSLMQ